MFPRVVEYIDELTKDYAQAARIDFMKHAREMARLRDLAIEKDQFSAAINAEYRRGLLGGFYVDRKEVVTASLDNMSRKELKEKLEKYKEENQLIQDAEWKEIDNKIDEE
jgi:hypothetical protein